MPAVNAVLDHMKEFCGQVMMNNKMLTIMIVSTGHWWRVEGFLWETDH